MVGRGEDEFGRELPRIVVEPPGPASKQFARRLRKAESHNVTFVSDDWPVFWDAAVGANVRDADGNVYLDLTSAFGVALLGHSNPLVLDALQRQAGRLVHGMGDVHPPVVKLELLESLARALPLPDPRIVLSSTGSEAVETALKTAQIATGRPGVVAFEGAYHGLTLGSLAVTHREHFRAPFESRVFGGVDFVPFPDRLGSGSDAVARSLEALRRLLVSGTGDGSEVGAVIVEPIQARGGARVPPPGFMAEVSRLAHEAGALVIADEIFTGLGRCGSLLASDLVGLHPDIVCLGKALGGGLPLSACVARAEVMDRWPESSGEAVHTSTFLGHPLACAVGCEVLSALEGQAVPRRAREEGARLLDALRIRVGDLPGVADVRGLGLLLGIEFSGDAHEPGRASRIAEASLRRGLIVLPAGARADVLELAPPVGLTDAQREHAVDALAGAIQETS